MSFNPTGFMAPPEKRSDSQVGTPVSSSWLSSPSCQRGCKIQGSTGKIYCSGAEATPTFYFSFTGLYLLKSSSSSLEEESPKMNWDLDLVRIGERLKEKEMRLCRLRRTTAGGGPGRKEPQQEWMIYSETWQQWCQTDEERKHLLKQEIKVQK